LNNFYAIFGSLVPKIQNRAVMIKNKFFDVSALGTRIDRKRLDSKYGSLSTRLLVDKDLQQAGSTRGFDITEMEESRLDDFPKVLRNNGLALEHKGDDGDDVDLSEENEEKYAESVVLNKVKNVSQNERSAILNQQSNDRSLKFHQNATWPRRIKRKDSKSYNKLRAELGLIHDSGLVNEKLRNRISSYLCIFTYTIPELPTQIEYSYPTVDENRKK
jgi:hypothetical protein